MSVQSVINKLNGQLRKEKNAFRKTNAAEISTAFELGRAGFHAGKNAPANCKEVLELFKQFDGKPGCSEIFKAWMEGCQKELLIEYKKESKELFAKWAKEDAIAA
jgi:hypothetical protein